MRLATTGSRWTQEPRRGAWLTGAMLLLVASVALAAARPSAQHLWILLVLAPLFEEIVFRAGVQDWLSGIAPGRWRAIVGTALLFATAHVIVSGELGRFAVALPALAIGVVYAHTRRLRDCVALHAVMNALWLVGLAIL